MNKNKRNFSQVDWVSTSNETRKSNVRSTDYQLNVNEILVHSKINILQNQHLINQAKNDIDTQCSLI